MPTPAITNNYRYKLSDQIGEIIVSPLGEGEFTIEWNFESDTGKRFYSKSFGGKIVFKGAAYKRLLMFEKSIYRCVIQKLTVERRCVDNNFNENWDLVFSGNISLNAGEWDEDSCQVLMKFEADSPDACFKKNKGTKINLFGIDDRYSVSLYPSNIVLEKVQYTNHLSSGDCSGYYWGGVGSPDDGRWTPYFHSNARSGTSCVATTKWVRQTIAVSCTDPAPSGGWVLVSNTCTTGGNRIYARTASLYNCQTTISGDAPDQSTLQSCLITGDVATNTQIDNGLKLNDVIKLFVDTFCPSLIVKSDFLQFNPDVVSDINYATGSASKVKYILVYQKSDVKRPGVSNNATIAQWTFEKLMTTLKYQFNLDWRIEGNIFRIEHVSYWTKEEGINLLDPKYERYIIQKKAYSYKSEKIPRSEIWKYKEASVYSDFSGEPITYSECVTDSSGDVDTTYAMDDVTTDLQLVLENPSKDSGLVSDDGFVFIAASLTAGQYSVLTEDGILSTGRLNNTLAISQLLRDYHMYERPLPRGVMNRAVVDFYSTLPLKKGVPISIPFCCGDQFNPDDTVTSPLGTGIVEKATFDFNTGMLELDLVYEANVGLTQNKAPVAGHDAYTIYTNTIGVFDVTTNDTDEDPSDYITAVEIVSPPTHGNAYVDGLQIRYTPFAGFVGNDLMSYRIHDMWGAASNLALITVTVRPVNSPPVANPDSYTVYTQTMPATISAPGPLANDTDDFGFTLQSYDAVSTEGGTVSMLPSGQFTYNRPSGFTGTDTFTYTIVDGGGLTATTTVTLTVISNNVPVANPDVYSTNKNTSLPLSATRVLTSNDTTPAGGPYTYTATAETKATTSGGTVTIQTNGQFIYTPASNFVGDDTFTYTVSNGSATAVGTVTIHVLPTIYAKLVKTNQRLQKINGSCGGSSSTYLGTLTTADFNVFFYSNAGGTTPINVSGYGLMINVREDIADAFTGNSSIILTRGPATGTSWNFGTEEVVKSQLNSCDGDVDSSYTATFSLSTGNYIII
jgi:hypothetical protein